MVAFFMYYQELFQDNKNFSGQGIITIVVIRCLYSTESVCGHTALYLTRLSITNKNIIRHKITFRNIFFSDSHTHARDFISPASRARAG